MKHILMVLTMVAFVLEICCQQFVEYVSVEYICRYWIYHANTWVMNVSWRVSVCPSGTRLGNVHFWKCIIVLVICCHQFGEYVLIENIGWHWIYDATTCETFCDHNIIVNWHIFPPNCWQHVANTIEICYKQKQLSVRHLYPIFHLMI